MKIYFTIFTFFHTRRRVLAHFEKSLSPNRLLKFFKRATAATSTFISVDVFVFTILSVWLSHFYRREKRTHSGEEPFGCSTCNKKFTLRGDLQEHQWSHSGEGPFSCSRCDKKFTLHGRLKELQRTHVGGEPFSCSTCDKNCALLDYVKEHQRTLQYPITDRMELPSKRSLLTKNIKRPECNNQPEGRIWKFDKQPSCNLLEFEHEYQPKVQNTEPLSTAMGLTMLSVGFLVKVLSNLPKFLYWI